MANLFDLELQALRSGGLRQSVRYRYFEFVTSCLKRFKWKLAAIRNAGEVSHSFHRQLSNRSANYRSSIAKDLDLCGNVRNGISRRVPSSVVNKHQKV